MFYNLSGGQNYRLFALIYLLLYLFSYSDLFEKIEPDEYYRDAFRLYLRFFLELYFYVFIYYYWIAFTQGTSFAVHMIRIFVAALWIQINFKLFDNDDFRVFMVFHLFVYLFISVYSEQPLF